MRAIRRVKLLFETTDRALLLEKAALLRARGIPVHVEDVPHAGVVPSHLYVVFDRHYSDARLLMQDAGHIVSSPVFDEELEEIADELREAKLSVGSNLLRQLLLGVLFIMAVSYVATRLFG